MKISKKQKFHKIKNIKFKKPRFQNTKKLMIPKLTKN